MRNLWRFFAIFALAGAPVLFAQERSTDQQESATPPSRICSPKHKGTQGCRHACNDPGRPAAEACLVLPHPKFTPDPEYTEEARKAREQGTVLLAVVVDENGDIRDVQVKRSLALGLDDSAMETIRRWKFEPATMEGKPVPVQLQVERNFRLLTGLRSQGRECSASRRVALEMRSRPRAAPASVTATLRQTHFFVVIQ